MAGNGVSRTKFHFKRCRTKVEPNPIGLSSRMIQKGEEFFSADGERDRVEIIAALDTKISVVWPFRNFLV